MHPALSIIIPHYNHNESLPALLDSVQAQIFTDYEILVVDDSSDEPCDALVDQYKQRGMDIRLLKNPCRQYTKDTRLNGVEASCGDYIMFIDADDELAGATALQAHMDMIRCSGADLLQFSCAYYENGKLDPQRSHWTSPLDSHLEGSEIFARYVRSELPGHLVYGKIATQKLWRDCLEAGRAIPIRRYQEDLLLASLLYLHARSYVGSPRFGYKRNFVNRDRQKACGRAAANYLMITRFMPYVRRMVRDQAILSGLENYFHIQLQLNTITFLSQAANDPSEAGVDRAAAEIKQHIQDDFIKIFLTSRIWQPDGVTA